MVALLDYMESLEPPLEAGPDTTQVLQDVVRWVKEQGVQEGNGEPGVDQGGGGGVRIGGDEGEELYIELVFEFVAVVVGLDRPLLVVVPQPLNRTVRPLHPLRLAVAPILPA